MCVSKNIACITWSVTRDHTRASIGSAGAPNSIEATLLTCIFSNLLIECHMLELKMIIWFTIIIHIRNYMFQNNKSFPKLDVAATFEAPNTCFASCINNL
ncbi:hypothetical protein Hanom_Chr07g00580551 [Helianthus anomalus]